MNNQFDELAKKMAQSVTRRAALKKFGVGLAAAVLASLGLANKAQAGAGRLHKCGPNGHCPRCYACGFDGYCYFNCI